VKPYRFAIAAMFLLAITRAGLEMIEPLFMRFIVNDILLNTTLDRQAPRDPRSNARLVASTDIPHEYVVQGARLTYEAVDDSMSGTGIAKGDVLFVRPSSNREDAHGQIVICRVDGADHVGVLDVRADRLRLLSRNKRYPPLPISKESRFELIGIVVGRTGLVT